jgi:hypothetical protein
MVWWGLIFIHIFLIFMKSFILILVLVMFGSDINSQINFFHKKNKKIKVEKEVETKPLRDFIPPKWGPNDYGSVEPNFNKKLVLQEIAHLLDSIREYMYMCDLLVTEVDTIASKGAEHHCKYLKNLINPNDPTAVYLTHNEFKSDHNSSYVGKDTLIYWWGNRMRYYAKDLMGFCGEVCSAGPLSLISYKGLTPKEIAKQIIYGFHYSKEHWEILTYYGYTKIAADIQIRKNPDGDYDYWFTLATGYNVITTKTTHKSQFYYPGNTLGLTEYYDIVDRKCIFNIIN